MALRLSPKDEAEYQRLSSANELVKQAAIARNDDRAAKKARQAQSALYARFHGKQLPPPPPTKYERESDMTVNERIDRIERHLKLGQYADDFYE